MGTNAYKLTLDMVDRIREDIIYSRNTPIESMLTMSVAPAEKEIWFGVYIEGDLKEEALTLADAVKAYNRVVKEYTDAK